MKPNFALYFTEDSLGLLHRTAHGWMEVGATPLDTPDLGEAMSYLRRSALGLEPHGVATKLVIPNSQVLYLTVTAPGPGDDERDLQIRAALEGRTPYEVDELLFDWSGDGPEVQLAVVARETVQEAEDFAASFRLNPVSCVAVPDPHQFAGEPWFGPTETAAGLLEDGDLVERDAMPVTVISRTEALAAGLFATPDAEAVPEPEWAAEDGFGEDAFGVDVTSLDLAEADLPLADDMEAEADLEADLPAGDLPEPDMPEPDMPGPDMPQPEDPQPVAPAPELPEPEPDLPEPEAEPEIPQPDLPEPDLPAPDWPEEPEPDLPAELPAPDAPDEAPAFPSELPADAPLELPEFPDADQPDDFMQSASVAAIAPAPEDDDNAPVPTNPVPQPLRAPGPEVIPPVGVAASLAGTFASRRSPAEHPGVPPLPPPRKAPSAPLTAPRLSPSAPVPRQYDASHETDNDPYEDEVFAFPGAEDDETDPAPPPVMRAAPPMPSALARRAAQLAATPKPAGKPASGTKPAAKPGKGAQITAPTIPGFGGRKVKPAAPAPMAPQVSPPLTAPPVVAAAARPAAAQPTAAQMQIPTPAAAAETLVAPPPSGTTPFRPKARPAARGKPRYLGLALTVVLLLILAVIAAWSSFYLARGSDTPEVPVVAAEPVPDAALPAADAAGVPATLPAPSPEDEAAADGIAPEDVTVAEPAPEAAPEAVPALPPAADAALAPALLPAVQDEIILSTMDSAPPAADAQALALPQTGADTLPQAAPVPPPFGTSYEFDAAGLIKPTADGIVTPEGYRLVAGAPPVVPPARPAAIAALAPAPLAAAPLSGAPLPDATTQPAPELPAGAIPTPDPALEAARPQARPADLVPQPDEGAIAPAVVENPLAGYRPRARPAAIIAAAEQRRLDDEARRVAEAASIAAAAAAEELAAAEAAAAKAAAEPVSPLAVAISRKPPQRPRGFDRAVEAAVAAAAAATLAPPPVAVAAAAPAPKEEPQRSARTAVPGEDEEPDVAAAAKAPRIPSSASVAKNATYVNAIDLRKTNLIGVYGTPAKRYALIRTSGGQYRKVNVGDRVDGGTVAAITDSELRYKKGSRMLTLALPQG